MRPKARGCARMLIVYSLKQYVKIKLMQNEGNRLSIFLVKTKYWQKFDLKA